MNFHKFDYIDRRQSSQFDFIRIPKAMMVSDGIFSELSVQAKLVYGMLLDRMSVSLKNRWLDEQNRAYIIYPVKDIAEDLKISLRKAIDYLTELENFGLIEKKQRGQGKPSIIYVKNFIYQDPKG
ncbi:replication initiator protein A [Oribacterium sp. P6A1]|uniref:replication initiator protein A n=1 Tax=Oribacterium sp. P6A1 TaxID=1410612 RepID=UPI00056177D6|nr:replication initiator protein A [Oribacterium sp. P6A1]